MDKNILVFCEQRDGKLQKIAFELLGKAAGLSETLGGSVTGVLIGGSVRSEAAKLIAHGAAKVIVAEHQVLAEYLTEPYAKALTLAIRQEKPDIVLIGATSIGRDLAPRVSARIHTGLTADCTGLEIDPETENLLMTRPAFGGNIMATIVCAEHRPQMATVRPGVMQAIQEDSSRAGEIVSLEVEFGEKEARVEIVEIKHSDVKAVDITESKILISGGRGIGGPEAFENLERLAEVLGGEVSSSRANVDAGWIDKSRQVGQTGKTVRPSLYFACGISGAIQHVAGMQESDLVIAINKNSTAPIFDYADLGVVGDAGVIVPKLIDAIKRHKEEAKV